MSVEGEQAERPCGSSGSADAQASALGYKIGRRAANLKNAVRARGNKSLRQRFFRAMAANDQTKTLVMVILINIIGLIILWLWTP